MTAILSIQFAEKLDLDFAFGWRSAGAPSTPGFGVMGWSAGARPRRARLLAARRTARLLAERLYGPCFVVLDIEDSVELRDLQQIVHFLGEVEQLQFATLVFGSSEGADKFADA